MAPLIGIDLGTTNSLCAVFETDGPKLIPNAHGQVLTPSIVGVTEKDQVLIGATAKELRVTRPERCAWAFKRWMGTDRTIDLGGHEFNAPALSSIVLQSLKQDAEAYFGEPVQDAVITVPAYFNDNQRKATKAAGELAGLRVLRILNEPTAAALTYGFHDREAERKLIVIDLGGGTFDVTTMEVFEGTLEIISTAGEGTLGGEDFTDRLLGWVLEGRGLSLETSELRHPLLVSRLRQECEAAKCRLFEGDGAQIRIPDVQGKYNENPPHVELNRADFAKLVDPLVKRLARPISKAIRDSRQPVEQFSDVILVGGATRMLPLREFVRTFFSREPLCKFNPDEVVALGAAVQAALIRDDRAVSDIVMTDICPFTLGVEVSKEFGRTFSNGYFLPVIHRNTTIPVSREQVVQTVHPNQAEIRLAVYQGDARKVKDNLFLGELSVRGIPAGPSGQPVHVRFTYDLNGILEVEALIPETGKRFSTVLTNHAKNLSKSELQSAVKLMQKLKFYPRDDAQNRHLVLYAERIVGEVSPFQRDELEGAIDAFEQSMSSGEREYFEQARGGLLTILSMLGFPYENDDRSPS